jgi:tetratricopeptide (TPR) repeat protein
LHQRTTGNPLYLVCLIDELERLGKIDTAPGSVAAIVPDTLQQMFEHQASQLSQPEQNVLAAAAVAGESFSIASVAATLGVDEADVESLCEPLVRQQMILKHGEIVRFPDGMESPGYSFIHVLCRDALYRRVPAARRSRLHGLLAQAEEKLYAADPKRVAGELAGHFEIAGDFDHAIQYLRVAAEVAAARQSNQEATRYIERALGLVERLPVERRSASRMDLLDQRSLMLMSTWDLRGAIASFRELADQACTDAVVDRRIRALLELSIASAIIDHRQGVAGIEEAQSVQSLTGDPANRAMVDLTRAFFHLYMFGWNQEYADLFQTALPRVQSLTDVRLQSRLAWMESGVLTIAGEYGAACRRAEQCLQTSRQAGIYFDYFVALLHLNWAGVHRGDLGLAIRMAKDGAQSAARNGSPLPLLWFSVRENWARMEAGDFETTLPVYEQHAARLGPGMPTHHHPIYMWLGLARLGSGDPDGAWEALEKASATRSEVGFQISYPLLDALGRCALARGDFNHSRALARELLQSATEHRQHEYAARAYRLLAEVASLEGEHQKAAAEIERAIASLQKCEAWSVEWQVHATAARVFDKLGRHQESQDSLELGRRAADRVAATLFDEPELQQKFMKRVTTEVTIPA